MAEKNQRGKFIFLRYWSLFFNNAGNARPMVCTVTTIKPMAAAKLHTLWLEGPLKAVRMGRASGYILRAFAKTPQIFFSFFSFVLRDSKPSPLNKPLQRIQTSLSSAESLLLSRPQHLQQLVHWFPAAIRRVSLTRTLLKEQISRRCCKWRTVIVTLGLPCTPKRLQYRRKIYFPTASYDAVLVPYLREPRLR